MGALLFHVYLTSGMYCMPSVCCYSDYKKESFSKGFPCVWNFVWSNAFVLVFYFSDAYVDLKFA